MENVDVLILFEHKSREFESACLLKYEFERRGLTAVIEGVFPNKEILPLKYKMKYLITPWYYTNTKYIANFLKNSPDAVIVNLHHEQYSTGRSDSLVPKGESRNVYHVAWGQAFVDQLIEVGCNREKIIEAGNIRLDLFKGILLKLLPSKDRISTEFLIDKRKKWVLFIADNSHLLEPYQLSEKWIKDREKYVFNIASMNRNNFLLFVDQYLSKHKDVVFIYRPHPNMANKDLQSEDLKILQCKYPQNFLAIYKYALNCWLVNCDICLSFYSSSFIETYMANTQYFLFRYIDIEDNDDYQFFQKYEYKVHNYADFENLFNGMNYDRNIIKKRLEYYYELSSEFTFRKIVENILSIKDSTNVIKYNRKDWLYNFFKAYLKVILCYCARFKSIKKILTKLNDNRINRIIGDTDDVVSPLDVSEYMEKLDKLRP